MSAISEQGRGLPLRQQTPSSWLSRRNAHRWVAAEPDSRRTRIQTQRSAICILGAKADGIMAQRLLYGIIRIPAAVV